MEGLVLGLTLGVAAGVSPGPMLALVITESLRSGWRAGAVTGAVLVAGFYLTLVGAKVALALLVSAGRGRLGGTGHRRALRAAAGLLVLAGVALVVEFGPTVLG